MADKALVRLSYVRHRPQPSSKLSNTGQYPRPEDMLCHDVACSGEQIQCWLRLITAAGSDCGR